MENAPITITLTVAECNVVLNALAARPYGEVVSVVTAIKAQGEKAVAELQAAAAETEAQDAPAE
jgi:biopolymer transport protein ExbD